MKSTKSIIVAIVVISLLFFACAGPAISKREVISGLNSNPSLSQIALEVSTISCSACQDRVKASAAGVLGVIEVKFDRKKLEAVIIVYDPAQTTPEAIVAAIEKPGDKVVKVTRL